MSVKTHFFFCSTVGASVLSEKEQSSPNFAGNCSWWGQCLSFNCLLLWQLLPSYDYSGEKNICFSNLMSVMKLPKLKPLQQIWRFLNITNMAGLGSVKKWLTNQNGRLVSHSSGHGNPKLDLSCWTTELGPGRLASKGFFSFVMTGDKLWSFSTCGLLSS